MHPIDQLCKEYGLTRYSLAKKSGVSDSSLANLVTRNTDVDNIKVGTLRKIAQTVGLSLDEVVKKLEGYNNE